MNVNKKKLFKIKTYKQNGELLFFINIQLITEYVFFIAKYKVND